MKYQINLIYGKGPQHSVIVARFSCKKDAEKYIKSNKNSWGYFEIITLAQ